MAVVVTVLGAAALGFGYKKHKQRSILVLLAVGLAFIFAGAYLGDLLPNHWYEVAITLAAAGS